VFSQGGAISKISKLLEMWKDPKTYNMMHRKDMLRNWTFAHLSNCV